jgi:hypothetical protein
MKLMCLRMALVLLIFRGVAGAQNLPKNGSPAQMTGVFSNLVSHPETQDVIGYEITVSRVGDRGLYFVVLQCAQGVPEPPVVSQAKVTDGVLTFSSSDPICGSKFRAKPGATGMLLWVDGKSQGLIPRADDWRGGVVLCCARRTVGWA